jgi:hypothetical protein
VDVKLALLADGANATAEGKLNILGIFNALHAASFPCAHPHMCLVLRFEATRAEENKTRNLEIQLADSDGTKVFAINASLVVPPGQPGMPIRLDHIIALNGVRFPKAGDYVFNVLIGDDQKASVDLKLIQTKAPMPATEPEGPLA